MDNPTPIEPVSPIQSAELPKPFDNVDVMRLRDKHSKIWLATIIVLALIAVLIFVIGSILIYRNSTRVSNTSSSTSSFSETNSVSSSESSSSSSVEMAEFRGQFISATYPNDWQIIEYTDEQGMYSKTGTTGNETVYSGLTGFDIKSPSGTSVFKMSGIDGSGFVPICSVIYRFGDTDPEFVANKEQLSQNVDGETATVVDLPNDYSSYSLFGVSFRRVDNKLYYNTNSSGNNFDPSCGPLETRLGFTDKPSFTGTSPSSGTSFTETLYYFEYEFGSLTGTEKTQLENILNSMSLVS